MIEHKKEMEEFHTDMVGCARCDGEGHKNIHFVKFTRPAGNNGQYTHWAICPTLYEPILMEFIDE